VAGAVTYIFVEREQGNDMSEEVRTRSRIKCKIVQTE
jgi:hypothetical protein